MRSALAERLAAAQDDVRARVTSVDAGTDDLSALGTGRRFDVVLCHGVLMYLPDPGPVVVALSDLVAPGGVLSLLARNADAMALRPGLRRQWADVLDTIHYELVTRVGGRFSRRYVGSAGAV